MIEKNNASMTDWSMLIYLVWICISSSTVSGYEEKYERGREGFLLL